MMGKIQGVLLDIDGTLALSNDDQARSWVAAFAEQGYDVPFDRVRPLIGMGGDKVLDTVTPGLNDKEDPGKTIAERRKEIVMERYIPHIAPAPGARELVQRMQEAGLRVIVATSAKPDELEAMLKAVGVDDLLPERTTSDDAEQSKPAPDIVSVALERIGLPASAVLMIGDTPYDVEAAAKIGVSTIAVRCGGFSDDDLKDARAIYDDPVDLVTHYGASPLSS